MNILFFSYAFYPHIGGIEVNSEILANQFVIQGSSVKLVTLTKEPGNKSFNFDVIREPSLKQLFQLYKWTDVVYENNPTLSLSWPNIIFRKPRVVAVRTWIRRTSGKKTITDFIKRFWVNKANKTIAISNAIKNESCNEAVVIGNPYRSNIFKVISDTSLITKDFIFIGRLVSDKGVDMCIQLMDYLKQNKQNFRLSIVGDGPEKNPLKKMVSDLELDASVKFLGFLEGEKLVQTIQKHQFFLVPSRWEEPFGNVALEGMACGCIPIVSDGGGLPDAVGNAGVIFERNNLKDLVNKTVALLGNEPKQIELKNKAKQHLANHTEERIGKRYYAVIKKALE